jgi:hypothetical protein
MTAFVDLKRFKIDLFLIDKKPKIISDFFNTEVSKKIVLIPFDCIFCFVALLTFFLPLKQKFTIEKKY